jgi:hypothetical protein
VALASPEGPRPLRTAREPGYTEAAVNVRTIARIALTVAGAALALPLALFAVWFAINAFDEKPSALAQSLLARPASAVPAEQNLYFAFAGFDAPAGQAPIEAGERRVAAYDQAYEEIRVDPDVVARVVARESRQRLAFRGDTAAWPVLRGSIWNLAKTKRDELGRLRSDNAELLARYRSLHALRGYRETARPSLMLPPFFVPSPVRALYVADLATRLQSGSADARRAALAELRQDLQLWSTVLHGEGGILSKLIASAGIHGDLLLLGDLVTDPDVDLGPLESELEATLTPSPASDWRVGDAYVQEFRARAQIYSAVPLANSPVVGSSARPDGWWERQSNRLQAHFFQRNATENLDAELARHLRALADGDPGDYTARRSAHDAWVRKDLSFDAARLVYNPVGRTLIAISISGQDDYPARVYDVAAMQRLVFAAYQVRRRGISADGVPALLAANPDWGTHPVDRAPLQWDGTTRSLAVVCVGKHPAASRFTLVLDVPGAARARHEAAPTGPASS